jgi:hypothetical protein
MSGVNWNRPRFRREGKLTEDVGGADVVRLVPVTPRQPSPSKAELRADADRALKAFGSDRIKVIPPVEQPAPKRRPAPIVLAGQPAEPVAIDESDLPW